MIFLDEMDSYKYLERLRINTHSRKEKNFHENLLDSTIYEFFSLFEVCWNIKGW